MAICSVLAVVIHMLWETTVEKSSVTENSPLGSRVVQEFVSSAIRHNLFCKKIM